MVSLAFFKGLDCRSLHNFRASTLTAPIWASIDVYHIQHTLLFIHILIVL
jgi:hypothetical protein